MLRATSSHSQQGVRGPASPKSPGCNMKTHALKTFLFTTILAGLGYFAFFKAFPHDEANQMKSVYPIAFHPKPFAETETPPLPAAENKSRKLMILLWSWPHGHKFPLGVCLAKYGIDGCHLTENRSWYENADAVVIHHGDVSSNISLLPPQRRPPNQLWVWFNMEPPIHLSNLHIMDNLINLTLSYRHDSDIFSPYGWFENLNEAENFTIPKKTKLVSWVISNWKPQDKRVQFYEELKKHIPIEIFGRGHLAVPDGKILPTISQYKFYLAFENCQHRDYITEKLWRYSLFSMTVPVVLGPPRENYELFLPADSFIHIDDFPSAKELATYLLQLDADEEQYRRFFN
ncbi:3-galactosyl-N-acetylglucosaminide 4-alpha-L-fucosyltransferase FUT3-like [Ambystoma mexicanum]|uniref:3-galactosyl-N-acetylglucosaminide 4-alpha-L-fucosyltransferase FUT3-like n=1 Tax=Ambystoma mexicanum TaxID=8296 RepID=UPI0037E953B1